MQRGGKRGRGKGKGSSAKAEANRELERQQAEMEDATIRCLLSTPTMMPIASGEQSTSGHLLLLPCRGAQMLMTCPAKPVT